MRKNRTAQAQKYLFELVWRHFSHLRIANTVANLDSNAIYAALTNDSQVLVNQVLFLSKESSLVTIKQSVSMITSNLLIKQSNDQVDIWP